MEVIVTVPPVVTGIELLTVHWYLCILDKSFESVALIWKVKRVSVDIAGIVPVKAVLPVVGRTAPVGSDPDDNVYVNSESVFSSSEKSRPKLYE